MESGESGRQTWEKAGNREMGLPLQLVSRDDGGRQTVVPEADKWTDAMPGNNKRRECVSLPVAFEEDWWEVS